MSVVIYLVYVTSLEPTVNKVLIIIIIIVIIIIVIIIIIVNTIATKQKQLFSKLQSIKNQLWQLFEFS